MSRLQIPTRSRYAETHAVVCMGSCNSKKKVGRMSTRVERYPKEQSRIDKSKKTMAALYADPVWRANQLAKRRAAIAASSLTCCRCGQKHLNVRVIESGEAVCTGRTYQPVRSQPCIKRERAAMRVTGGKPSWAESMRTKVIELENQVAQLRATQSETERRALERAEKRVSK